MTSLDELAEELQALCRRFVEDEDLEPETVIGCLEMTKLWLVDNLEEVKPENN